jgi:hypothetical protein
MKRILLVMSFLFILTATACGLIEDEGHCPTVENEDIYSLTFEDGEGAPIMGGFYGTVTLADGEEYDVACPEELGDMQYPQTANLECATTGEADSYDRLRLTGVAIPEIVAVAVSTADDSYHFDGDVELDVNSSSPRCGGGYRTGQATVVLTSH